MNQSVPCRIVLSIPRAYRREFPSAELPELPKQVIILRPEVDFGPATKILPILTDQFQNPDQPIVYCDDDRIYPEKWLARLLQASAERPDCCITYSGNFVSNIDRRFFYKTSALGKIYRVLALGMWKPWKAPRYPTYVQIARGFAGVLIKPKFFTSSVFNVPSQIWTVDDIWLSANMQRNAVKIYSLGLGRLVGSGKSEQILDLRRTNFDGIGRVISDKLAVDQLRSEFGIWTAGGLC